MDLSQIYCGAIVGGLLFIFLKSFLFDTAIIKNDDFPGKKNQNRRASLLVSRAEPIEEPSVSKPWEMPHNVEQLRHLTENELQNFNVQYGKMTDRYWREVFRRQNDTHHPDHINVSRLQTANIITILDEHIPHGCMHELTIIGLVPKPISSRKCEVMRYLRDRIASTKNFELIFDRDRIRILPLAVE